MELGYDVSSTRGGSASNFGGDECGGAWDCSRELRILREGVSRNRVEEASALRRNAEELERCALRRQHDESTVLQHFLQGLHEAFEGRLERHRAHSSGRLDALERRLDSEVERLATLRCEVAAESRQAVREGFEKMDQYTDGQNLQGNEGFAAAIQKSMAKVSSQMQEAAQEAAVAAAREVAEGVLGGIESHVTRHDAQIRSERDEESSVVQTLAASVEGLDRRAQAIETSATAMNQANSDDANRRLEVLETQASELEMQVSEHSQRMEDLSAKGRHTVSRLDAFDEDLQGFIGRVGNTEGMARCSMESFESCITKVKETEVKAAEVEAAMQAVQAEQAQQAEMLAEHAGPVAEKRAQGLAEHACNELIVTRRLLFSEIEDAELSAREEVAKAICDFQSVHSELKSSIDANMRSTASVWQEGQEAQELLSREVEELNATFRAELNEALHNELAASVCQTSADVESTSAQLAELDAQLRQCLEERSQEHSDGLHVVTTLLREFECSEAKSLKQLGEECLELQGRWPEVSRIGKQLRETRQEFHKELASATSQWRTTAADQTQALQALGASCERFSKDITHFQEQSEQGLSHEWRIPKCMQRLEYLSMTEDQGVWLDSPAFTLGPLGQLEVRLYCRGLRGASGQCAAGVYSAADNSGLRAAPMLLDISIQGLRRRAVAKKEDNGGTLWLVQDLGKIETHLTQTEDLTISVEIPPHAWASMDACGSQSHSGAICQPTPTPARAPRAPPFVPEPNDIQAVNAPESVCAATGNRPVRPASAGRHGRSFPGVAAGTSAASGSTATSAFTGSMQDEFTRLPRSAPGTSSNLGPQVPDSPLSSPFLTAAGPMSSPLSTAAAPRNSWTVFGAETREAPDPLRLGTAQSQEASVGVASASTFDSSSSTRSCSAGGNVRRMPASPLAKAPPRGTGTGPERRPTSTNPFDDGAK